LIMAANNGSAGAKITHGRSVPEMKPPKINIRRQLIQARGCGSGTGFSTGLI
jgi:hypothetical protein